jgi:hypothetical protein
LELLTRLSLLIFLCLPLYVCSFDPQKLQAYEIPPDHPVKSFLDQLFKKSRFIKNPDTLSRAGFTCSGPRKHTGLIVARHPDTPGYIFKIYTDVQEFHKRAFEYDLWMLRIEGARRIRDYIDARGWNSDFKVPYKWIYIIPKGTTRAEGYYEKRTILVEEDMELLKEKKNLERWRSDAVTPELLDKVYAILTDIGLRDCAKPDNIPFSVDGRIAFIDTQTHDAPEVPYHRLLNYLSKPNRQYWKSLTK